MASKLRKIFLVDDDPMHLQMLKDHLSKKLNVEIYTFSTGEDCLNNMDKHPDVVVLDYNLNSVNKDARNGLEILKSLKQRNPDVEVVMLSGQDKIDVAVETMANGAFDYVVKNESSFYRTENKVRNIFNAYKLKENMELYRKGFILTGAVLVLIIIVIIALYSAGIITDRMAQPL